MRRDNRTIGGRFSSTTGAGCGIARPVYGRRLVGGNRPYRQPAEAFTLMEVLAAMMFLAILVPAVVAALSLSTRISTLAERRAVAAELAENQLNEELIANSWQTGGATQGDFGADYPGYSWQMTQTSWDGGGQTAANNMTELTMEVTFLVQGQAQSVKLTTLVSATMAAAQQSGTNGGSTLGSSSTGGLP